MTIQYTLVFNHHAEMMVEEYRTFNQPFNKDSVILIPPEKFDNYTVNGSSLRYLVLQKLEEILPRRRAPKLTVTGGGDSLRQNGCYPMAAWFS